MRRATLIYNPHAGLRDWDAEIRRFVAFWRRHDWNVTIAPTRRAGHATELAREAASEGCELVFAAGGDGTVNEIANGLAHSETALAVIPMGTANVLARELHLPARNLLNPDWLMEVSNELVRGRIQQMDLGRCDSGRYWLMWASTGIDSFVIERIEPRSRFFKRLGVVGYAAKSLVYLPSARSIYAEVEVDDQRLEGEFFMVTVTNTRLYAGGEVVLNVDGVVDDGQLEVWAFRGRGGLEMVRHFFVVGIEHHLQDENVHRLRGRNIRVRTQSPAPYHLDAEPAGDTPFTCEVQDCALRVLVPQSAPQQLFSRKGREFSKLMG